MIYLCISMTVSVEAVLTLSVGSSAATLATPGVVCDDWGRPRIPGELVCAKARHAAATLAHNLKMRPDDLAAIFGAGEGRPPLRFADLPGLPGLAELRQHHIRAVASERQRVAGAERILLDDPALEGTLFHSARAITGTLATLPQLGLLWAALRLAASHGPTAEPHEPAWAALDLEVRYATDGPPDLAAPSLDAVALGQMLRRVARAA